MELEINNSIESAVVPDDSFKEKNQQPETLEVLAQGSEAETNGYTGKHDSHTELEACDSLICSSTVPTTDSTDAKIACLEDEVKKARSELELLAVQHESELKLAHDKMENAEMRLIVAQEGAAVQIKDANEKILFLENELLKVESDLASAAADRLKLRSVEGESAILAEELQTSQSKLSELEGKLEMAEQQVQQLITDVESSTEKVSISEGLLAAAEAKTKETEERLALEIGFHQEEMKEMALKEESLKDLKEKVEAELETFRKGKLDVENDLKLALEKADEHWEQLMLKEQLGKESLARVIELQNAVGREKAMVSDAEQTIFSLQCEIEELKGQIAAGAEREAIYRENEVQFANLKQDYDSAQGNFMEVVAKLQSAEKNSEEQLHSLEAYEENAIKARENVSELERMLNISEDKLKSTEELVGTLLAELEDRKLSGVSDAELLKETKLKSAQLEEELLSKLKVSEERCQELDMSVGNLTERSSKLEESLDALQTVAKSGDMKITELEVEIKNLQQFKEELEEKLRVADETCSQHENSAKQSMERAIELDGLITKHQAEANDATNRAGELDVTLLKVQERNSELEFLLKSAEDKSVELETEVKQVTERASELEEYVKALKSEANNVTVLVDELELSLTNSRQREKELLERLEITEGRFLEQENAAGSSRARVAELDELIAGMETEMNDLKVKVSGLEVELENANNAMVKANELDAALLKVQERNSELEFLFKSAEDKSVELETEVKQVTERASELEEYVKVLKSDANNATVHADELELSLTNSRQREQELLERLEITEGRFLEQENAAGSSRARVAELDELIASMETEMSNLKVRVSELEVELENANNAMAKANELDAALLKLQERNSELEFLFKSAEDKSVELETEVKQVTERASELEEYVKVLKSEANNATVHADELELSLTNSRQREQELLERLEITEGRFLEQENAAGSSRARVAELDELIASMETEMNNLKVRVSELEAELGSANSALAKANELELALVNSREKEQELLKRLEIAEERFLQQESTSKSYTDRITELDEQLAAMKFEVNTSMGRTSDLELELGNATQKAAVLQENLKDSETKLTVMEDSVKQLTSRSEELGCLLEVANTQAKDATDKVTATELVLLDEQQKYKQAEVMAKELDDNLCQLKDQIYHLETELKEKTTKHLEAESTISELQPFVGKLEAAEILASSLNERICAVEDRASKAETDLHTSILSESKLRDELSSLQVVISGLQTSSSQIESEKQELADQIDIAVRRSSELSEQLMQETSRFKETEMLVSTLNEKIAAAEEKANKSEADVLAAGLIESKLRDELSSHQALIENLQISLSQSESERQALDDQINSTTSKFDGLNEQLVQERQRLQEAETLINTLNEKIASAEERANKSEEDVHAAIVIENKLNAELSSLQILIDSMQTSLSQVESEKQSLHGQIDSATRNLSELTEQLMQERQQLQSAEDLANTLNEKISIAEERANKAEADAQASVLSESKLRDKLSSHEVSIGTLQTSLSQIESEKAALASQIDGATQSFNELNEKLMEERQQLQLQMETMMQENRDLTEKVASLQAEVREALSEIEASATQIEEGQLTEVSVDSEVQVQKSQQEKISDYVYVAELQHELEEAVSVDEHQAQFDQLVVTTKSLINKLTVAEEEKTKLRMENETLQKAVQNKENLVEELKHEVEKLHVIDEPDVGSMKSRDFNMDFAAPPVTIRRRKGAEATSVAGENLVSGINANGKAKHSESPVASSQLLFSLCVISMVSLFSGFWIARKVYL